MLQISDQFDHFQIRQHMAKGGMSDIYRAYDLLNGQEVVLKIPDRMSIGDPAQFERFQRELEVMRTLNHPAIQQGLGSGRYNNTPYLVTGLIDGQSMREIVRTSAPMPPEEAISLIRKIADGLAHCHDHEIIHRDLKPENILITSDGQPIIIDFGLALTKGAHRVTYANLSAAAGTPDYMAPEQIEGHRGDQRTDIYALGVMLFELLTGNPPYTGDNNMVIMAQHLKGAIPRLDKVKEGISPQIAAFVAKCLQRNPNDRYADMHALIAELDNLDAIDVSILERATGAAAAAPFWRSPVFVSIGSAILLLIIIVILALILQKIH
ncbi:MAG: serine/threonine-protein kinase [Ignavibacteriaceae bacterium]|nr:serine/threonine-protein kinase [Ignavibacteriaceae bacterium]